jgi:hypothetical protein
MLHDDEHDKPEPVGFFWGALAILFGAAFCLLIMMGMVVVSIAGVYCMIYSAITGKDMDCDNH